MSGKFRVYSLNHARFEYIQSATSNQTHVDYVHLGRIGIGTAQFIPAPIFPVSNGCLRFSGDILGENSLLFIAYIRLYLL